MPARPLSDETLHLIDAVRTALEVRSDVEERNLFGSHAFFVDGKVCIAVKNDDLLVRLPPERHEEFQEMQNTRELSPGGGMKGYFWIEPNGYATRAQWNFWVQEALAYNPRAKATPKRKPAAAKTAAKKSPATKKKPAAKRHSIFEADD
ncbi:TfoX N-terminal domain containing protein [Acidovorax sp. CF316]|uniref:TfoX/Sxy family protein n=1 Tax=Acidovorax sp. CF316 TaxID=1144317 RepID=UPI00026BD7AD|nr:TfoX/Sxy family protein [Acidovorax sp. CF316]EJE51690.1 TfoX N-terminal domain containing protein [Acidovorax sp. CF316]